MSPLSNFAPNEQILGINKQLPVDPGRWRCGIRALFGRRQIISRDLAVPWPPELLAATVVAATAHRVRLHTAHRGRCRGGGNDAVWVRELAGAGQPRHQHKQPPGAPKQPGSQSGWPALIEVQGAIGNQRTESTPKSEVPLALNLFSAAAWAGQKNRDVFSGKQSRKYIQNALQRTNRHSAAISLAQTSTLPKNGPRQQRKSHGNGTKCSKKKTELGAAALKSRRLERERKKITTNHDRSQPSRNPNPRGRGCDLAWGRRQSSRGGRGKVWGREGIGASTSTTARGQPFIDARLQQSRSKASGAEGGAVGWCFGMPPRGRTTKCALAPQENISREHRTP
jgi:hypothetical protein